MGPSPQGRSEDVVHELGRQEAAGQAGDAGGRHGHARAAAAMPLARDADTCIT